MDSFAEIDVTVATEFIWSIPGRTSSVPGGVKVALQLQEVEVEDAANS